MARGDKIIPWPEVREISEIILKKLVFFTFFPGIYIICYYRLYNKKVSMMINGDREMGLYSPKNTMLVNWFIFIC